jgi:hypothetical protein
MSFEIGPVSRFTPTSSPRPAQPVADGFERELARADRARLSIPAAPPPAVLDEVGAAAQRAEQLAAADRELHFRCCEQTGRVVVDVRDLAGNVLRTIKGSEALEVMAGASL